MANSKTDLSAEGMTLDYDDLMRVATIAFAFSRDQLEREINGKFYDITGEPVSPVYCESMLRSATALCAAGKLCYYLKHGRDREIIEVYREELKNA